MKGKKRKRRGTYSGTGLICGLILALGAGGIYFLSDDSHIQALACSGNYYFTPQEIYAIAGVSADTRMWLDSTEEMQKKLEDNEYIESASVQLQGRTISIDVNEKTIVGYYEDEGEVYYLFSDGDSVKLQKDSDTSTMMHVPHLVNLSEENRDELALLVRRYPDLLSKEVIDKIAEILSWKESYDENMFRLTMQDGNEVFSTIDNLIMLTNYSSILGHLGSEDACMLLDSENSTIDKIACSDFYASAEEREARRAQSREDAQKAAWQKVQEEKKKQQEEAQNNQNTKNTQNGDDHQTAEPEQPTDPDQTESEQSERVDVDDWTDSDYSWLYYSPSTGVYMSKYGDIQYAWDESTQGFRELQ